MPDSWYRDVCPECDAVNWWCNGDETDLTARDIEALRCRTCGYLWAFNDDIDELATNFPPDITEGLPPPGSEPELQQQVATLRQALEPFASAAAIYPHVGDDAEGLAYTRVRDLRRARAALDGTAEKGEPPCCDES